MLASHQGSLVVTVVSSHRLAGTALALFLQGELGCHVLWQKPGEPVPAPIVVLYGVHEELSSLPRLMSEHMSPGTHGLLIYDDARPSDHLLDAAHTLGLRNTFGVRGDPQLLVDQLQDLLEGRTWSQDRARAEWVRSIESQEEGLTRREQAVVECYYSGAGANVEEVATRLGISVNTVRVHLANVRRKLAGRHVGNRQALYAALVDKGWLD
ncbi:MAG TPA: LuxR C-terminal-related transcriptional regulator [Arachnia sp.]|nr:LuxR C-terminal-related transcriptional regulator [Arachnia sp.]HMT85158.1 LuxR C-terminal-related transcriptional regulator [Arachnia sp.]